MKHLHYYILFFIVFVASTLTIYLVMSSDFNDCSSFHYGQRVAINGGFYTGIKGTVVGKSYRSSELSVQLDSLLFPQNVNCSDMIK